MSANYSARSVTEMIKQFFKYSRAPFFSASILPVLLGVSLAYHQTGSAHWGLFFLTLIGLMAAHAGANQANDYFDYKSGADVYKEKTNPFSGGGGYLAARETSLNVYFKLFTVSFLIALGAGLALCWLVDGGFGIVTALMIIGFLGGFFYTAPPVKLAYRGAGEAVIICCFGVLPVVGVYYVQTRELSLAAVGVGLALAMFITAIIWINQFPDYEVDKAAGKRNLVVRLGPKKARIGLPLLFSIGFGLIPLMALKGVIPQLALTALLPIPLAARAVVFLYKHHEDGDILMPAQRDTVLTHTLTGLLLTIVLFVSK